ncbi:hypothetical protein Lalb_Chr17g0346861 [Lupinus albus]|uniref:Uncharacterized protein n=1 Tax=Lupinus albus TaxID=3870 RepID=A0A6A4P0W8_LUPAL|nr:hypothetical protein Lalb_Chr17g0346861 [Lupinus albus]
MMKSINKASSGVVIHVDCCLNGNGSECSRCSGLHHQLIKTRLPCYLNS